MRILIYTPTNARAVDLQSVMELFTKLGHDVFLLSQLPKSDLHRNVEKYGVKTFSSGMEKINGISSYLYNLKALKQFIKKHKIEVVFAHLQGAGLLAGIASKSIKFKLFYVRHNSDEHRLQGNKNGIIVNWLANRVTSDIIAPSEKVYRYLLQVEKIPAKRIIRINYGYNFNQYLETDRIGNFAEIRKEFECQLLLVSMARLTPVKRHLLMFDTIRELVKHGMDIKLICLGDGPSRKQFEKYIVQENLGNHVYLLGSKKNIFDYLEAGDIFFHLSETEASNSAVKEAGYCKKPVIVCKDVGDFEDYIKDGVNGYLLQKSDPVPGAIKIISALYDNPERIKMLGDNLHQTIVSEFGIEKVEKEYIRILESISNQK